MSTKRTALVFLVASVVLLAAGIGPQHPAAAFALPLSPSGGTIPYPGRLNDATGQPVADGAYDFTFALYAAETGGEPLWSEEQRGVAVQGGTFMVSLGRTQPIPTPLLSRLEMWLEIAVRGPVEASFTALAPRQAVSTPLTFPSSPKAGGACPHTHFGEDWRGSAPSWALRLINDNPAADTLQAWSFSPAHAAVYGNNAEGTAIAGRSPKHIGVYSEGGGAGHDHPAFKAASTNVGCGIASYMVNNSGCPTAEFDQLGGGRVLDLQNGGTGSGGGSGDFIAAFNKDASPQLKFRVGGKGDVWTRDGYYTISQDFAEMLPAVDGLAPGDVLIIGPDGKLARSSEPFQTSVAGVYSTAPGLVGGMPETGPVPGSIPLAMTGIAPVKVSAENGAIRPGDLLVTSATAGHAMKAGPNPPQGAVIGKALAPLTGGAGVIKMLATLQ
jgi:hypothetical protein